MTFLGTVKQTYTSHPRIFWVSFLILFWASLLLQSFIAEPRAFNDILSSTWEFTMLVFLLVIAFMTGKDKPPLWTGILPLLLSLLMYFHAISFIRQAYGTLMFIIALWLLGDYANQRILGTSTYHELVTGNYYMASGVFISTVLVGSMVELINIPFKVWWYSWPFPSIMLGGTPVFLIAFGWLPWVLAMFVFLYPWTTKKPR